MPGLRFCKKPPLKYWRACWMLLQPAIDRFHQNKRAAALLDFDDLIFAARDLLRDHEPVREALAQAIPACTGG